MQAADKRPSCYASFAEARPRRLFVRGFLLSTSLWFVSLTAAAQTSATDAKLNPPALAGSSPSVARSSFVCSLRNALGRPLAGISVELRSFETHSVVSRATSRQDGTAVFHDLAPGRYEVTVAGGILPPRRELQVDGHDIQFAVNLPLSQPVSRGSETVSIQQLTVPRKAREAFNAANEAWEKLDWRRVREQVTRALAVHPDYGAALAVLGFLEVREGNLELACADLKRAIEDDPNSALAYLTLGSAYNSMKHYDAALEVLSVFLSVSSDTWQLHYEIARAYIGLGKYEPGLREIDYAQRLPQPDPTALHLGKAHALLGLRRNLEAAAELVTIVREQPNGPFTSDAKGLLATLRSQQH